MIAGVIQTDGSAGEWDARFGAERVPCAPVNNYQEALEQDHIRERGLLLEVEHPKSGPIKLVVPPWKSSLPQPPLTPPPLLGTDKADVLNEWLGLAGS